MAGKKTFDIIENQDRLKFDLGAYVLGKAITSVVIEHDRVELYLEGDNCVAFSVDGKDIEVSVAIPERIDSESGVIN